MRRLTDEEREIRSGRGIPLRRWWHFPVLFIALFAASMDTGFLHRCTGWGWILDRGGRGGALLRMALTYPCSLYLVSGSKLEWILFAGLCLPLPFAYFNWMWMKRHKAYWDVVRQREKERRRQKAEQRKQQKDGSGSS